MVSRRIRTQISLLYSLPPMPFYSVNMTIAKPLGKSARHKQEVTKLMCQGSSTVEYLAITQIFFKQVLHIFLQTYTC